MTDIDDSNPDQPENIENNHLATVPPNQEIEKDSAKETEVIGNNQPHCSDGQTSRYGRRIKPRQVLDL